MFGDDYLSVSESLNPVGSGGFWSDVWLHGGGKWRPVTTPILFWLHRQFRFSYIPYQVLNLFLLIICATFVGIACYFLCKSVSGAALTSLAISVSHLTWYAQISVFGIMELLAIILVMTASACALLSINLPETRLIHAYRLQLMACLFLLLSTLTHERYLLTVICFWILYLSNKSRSSELSRRSWIFLLIPLTHVIFKGFLLNLDPIQGGGESRIRNVYGFWLAEHLKDSILGLLGYYSGSGRYYTPWPLGRLAAQSDLQILGVIMSYGPLVLILIVVVARSDNRRTNKTRCLDSQIFFLLSLTFATILPAATVIQRIESRWLLAPQIFFVLFCIAMINEKIKENKIKIFSLSLFPLCLSVVSVYYQSQINAFTMLRDQPSSIILTLGKVAPTNKPWVLSVTQSDSTMPTFWQFGYGQAFNQMQNPPYALTEKCGVEYRSIPCVKVELHGDQSPKIEISSPNEFVFSD
jgi:hypothetical protein